MKQFKTKWLSSLSGLILISLTSVNAQIVNSEQEDTTQSTINKMYQDIGLLKNLKVTGYIQAQYQFAQSDIYTNLTTGVVNEPIDRRFSIRRGRIKFTYDKGVSQLVYQLDLSERGYRLVEAFYKVHETKLNWFAFTAGIFNVPLGYEIPYSSSLRESPERGRMSAILIPLERDWGIMGTIQGPKDGNWNWLKLDLALISGMGSPVANGSVIDIDNNKDFVAHLQAQKSNKNESIKYGVGLSYYNGGYAYSNDTAYKMSTDVNGVKGFEIQSVNAVDYNKRRYYGADAQISRDSKIGITTLRAEVIWGSQPAFATSSRSPQAALKSTDFVYTRNFSGAYFYLVQNFAKLKVQAVVKYDIYDPNTDVSNDEVGKASTNGLKATNTTDIKYDDLGFGLNYLFNSNTKLMVYYDDVMNQKTSNITDYDKNLEDNFLTIRLQHKF